MPSVRTPLVHSPYSTVSASNAHIRVLTKPRPDRKSTRLNSSHSQISYAVFCLKTKILPIAYHGILARQAAPSFTILDASVGRLHVRIGATPPIDRKRLPAVLGACPALRGGMKV